MADALPASNAPLRDGKGTLCEGSTKVAPLASWPGRVPPGEVRGLIHVVDMLPAPEGLAGVTAAGAPPLDGMDVRPVIAEGAPSPRIEIVCNVDPVAGAVRQGDRKPVRQAALPPRLELFSLVDDPSGTRRLVGGFPAVAAGLQSRMIALASVMSPPRLIMEAIRLTFYVPPVTGDLRDPGPMAD